MRCSICKKELFYNIKFKDFFEFNFVCNNCKKLLTRKLTIIPIDNGKVIKYYYFLLKNEYIKNAELILSREILRIINNRRNEIVYLYDEDFIKNIKYLKFNTNIILVSVYYIELEYLIDEI